MSETMSLARRFRRYNETLYALGAAHQFGWRHLTRTQLQKILYLTEMLAPFRDYLAAELEYRFHHKGPYARDLQNGADFLVACGLAEFAFYEVAMGSHDVPTSDDYVERAYYRITEEGESLIEQLITTLANREMRELVNAICELVDIYGLSNVVTLVYQEPTFAQLKEQNKRGFVITSQGEGNRSTELLKFLNDFCRDGMRYHNSGWRVVFLAYFDLLWAQYQSAHAEVI